jgi:F-box protein 21
MYYERYRIDKVVLELLRDMTISRYTRNDKALMLSKMGFDVWDVLEIESAWTPNFRTLSNVEPPHALTLRFWAQRMMEVIAKEEAIDVWGTLLATADVPVERRASFEQTMLGLSAFFGQSMHDVSNVNEYIGAPIDSYVWELADEIIGSNGGRVPCVCGETNNFGR